MAAALCNALCLQRDFSGSRSSFAARLRVLFLERAVLSSTVFSDATYQ